MSKPTTPESAILKSCLARLEALGAFVWRQNQGAMTGEHNGKRRFMRFASADGISDIIGVLPTGHMIAVECKRKGGKATEKQMRFLLRVSDCGGCAILTDDPDEMEAEVRQFIEAGQDQP